MLKNARSGALWRAQVQTYIINGEPMVKTLMRVIPFFSILIALDAYSSCADFFEDPDSVIPLESALAKFPKVEVRRALFNRQVSAKYAQHIDGKVEEVDINGLVLDLFQPQEEYPDIYVIRIADDKSGQINEYYFTANAMDFPQFSKFQVIPPKVNLDVTRLPEAKEFQDGRGVDALEWLNDVLLTQDTVHGTINSLSQLVGYSATAMYRQHLGGGLPFELMPLIGKILSISRTENSEMGEFTITLRLQDGSEQPLDFDHTVLRTFTYFAIRLPKGS